MLAYSFTLASAKSPTNEISVVDFDGIRPFLEKNNDTTYVINFWATWCSPCVKEIPHFEKINQEFSNQKLKIILVSLDFPSQIDSRLIPFIEKRELKSQIIVLDDTNANYWINEVSNEWTGAIPATVIYRRGKREFFEKVFSYEELKNLVLEYLN